MSSTSNAIFGFKFLQFPIFFVSEYHLGVARFFDSQFIHDTLSLMKTATVADLRNNFATLSRWVHGGESIVITKRGIPFATLSPMIRRKDAAKPVDRLARLRKIFPEGPATGDIRDVIAIHIT